MPLAVKLRWQKRGLQILTGMEIGLVCLGGYFFPFFLLPPPSPGPAVSRDLFDAQHFTC